MKREDRWFSDYRSLYRKECKYSLVKKSLFWRVAVFFYKKI